MGCACSREYKAVCGACSSKHKALSGTCREGYWLCWGSACHSANTWKKDPKERIRARASTSSGLWDVGVGVVVVTVVTSAALVAKARQAA